MELLISFVVFVLVIALLFWLLRWALPKMGVSGQVINVITVVFVVIVILVFLSMLTGYLPRPF